MCGIENINDWVLKRKQEWNEHINRMDENRLVKTAHHRFVAGVWEDHVNVGATIYQLDRHRQGAKKGQAICLARKKK